MVFMPGEKIKTGNKLPGLAETVLANIIVFGRGYINTRERVLINDQVGGWSNN